jgi:predicted amidohydrolase
MTFRIAVVQPISHPPGEARRNLGDAVRWIERAAGEGANFICFPETYPGPWRMPATFDPTAALCESAAKHGVGAGAVSAYASERTVDLYRWPVVGIPIRRRQRFPGL